MTNDTSEGHPQRICIDDRETAKLVYQALRRDDAKYLPRVEEKREKLLAELEDVFDAE